MRTGSLNRIAFGHNWGWFITWGIVLFIAGVVAISLSVFTTLLSIYILGILILIGGIISIIDSFTFWWKKWRGFLLHFLLAIFYIIVGIIMIRNPIVTSISITLLLGIFYLALGVMRIIYFLATRNLHWGWGFFNGVVSLVLGILILMSWPSSGLFIIGLFVGIDLLLWGWSYIMIGAASRFMKPRTV